MIAPPKLTPAGNYDPAELKDFLRRCDGMKPYQIADCLKVSVDRVHYLLGDGYPLIMRQRERLAQ